MSNLLLVAGMSGAGRSSVAGNLEDLGWFVIDNMPPTLISKVVELAEASNDVTDLSVALVVGRELTADPEGLASTFLELKKEMPETKIMFLDSSDEVLVQRYEGTKRRHPVQGTGVLESVLRERELMSPIKDLADIVIDTSDLTVHQLRDRVAQTFERNRLRSSMSVVVNSFGYKFGLPRDADLVLDCRFLANPYWDHNLRELTGLDAPVQRFLEAQEDTVLFIEQLRSLLTFLLPRFDSEGKSYLSIALGCTGGKHRSVYIAERIAEIVTENGFDSSVRHRDVAK